ncbi:MAG: response regulator transcription factor [Fibrobacterota bacterium]
MEIKVILADDHAVVRHGIRAIVEKTARDIVIAGEAANGKEVLRLARRICADVFVLDISMPVLNGLETAERLLKIDKRARIIFLSMYDNRTFIEQALHLGVKSYLLKESATEEIVAAIRSVFSGTRYFSPKILKHVVVAPGRVPEKQLRLVRLTPREREVLQLISEGHSTKEIAARLNRSANTVHVHRNSIMQKLDIHNQAELVRYSLKSGISQL